VFLYRLLLSLAAPLFALRLWRDGADTRRERLGGHGPDRITQHQRLWIHAASNGELTSARPLIEALLNADARLDLVITCNSETGKALARGWHLPRTDIRSAPLDYRWALRRFMANWSPDALVVVENELWPNRMAMMHGSGRAVMIVSARLSERSAKMWNRLPALRDQVLSTISLISAQDNATRDRFLTLGAAPETVGRVVNLKLRAGPAVTAPEDAAAMRAAFPPGTVFLAASTHEGEDGAILLGFERALAHDPDLRLILAPRHPRRAPEIIKQITRMRLPFAVRSQGQSPRNAAVYLADTLGEMALWYGLADWVFVGGSLVDKGGHTPFEPAQFGCAILHGPHLSNFAEGYDALMGADASVMVQSADDIARALHELDQPTRAAMAARANTAIAGMTQGDMLAPLLRDIGRLAGNSSLT